MLIKNYNKILKINIHKSSKRTLSNLLPKEKPEDSLINWKNNMEDILQLIKSSTIPFSGAFSYLNKKITIFGAV